MWNYVEDLQRFHPIWNLIMSMSQQLADEEGKFFRNGMSLNQVFKLHIHQKETYCLHVDWFFGYIANYLNISRHVVPKGEFPVVGFGGRSAMFYGITKRGRKNLGWKTSQQCVYNASICHYIYKDPIQMKQLYMEAEYYDRKQKRIK